MLDVNVYLPKTIEKIGEGWEPLSHTLISIGEDVLLTILVKRDTTIPDRVPDSFT